MKRGGEEGSILVLTVIIFTALLMLGAIAANSALAGYRMRRTSAGINADYYVAESGVEEVRALAYVMAEKGIDAGVSSARNEILKYDDELLRKVAAEFAAGADNFAELYPYIKISDDILLYDESYINQKAETCFTEAYKNYVKEQVTKYGTDKLTCDRDGHVLSKFKEDIVIRVLNTDGKPLSTAAFDYRGFMKLSVSSSYGADGGWQKVEATLTVGMPEYEGPYFNNDGSPNYEAGQVVWLSELKAIR